MKLSSLKAAVAIGLFASAATSTAPAHALGNYPYAIPCNGCARVEIPSMLRESYANQDRWFVYDLQSRTLYYYSKQPGPGGRFNIAQSTPDAKAQAYFNEVLDFYTRNHNSLVLRMSWDMTSLKASNSAGAIGMDNLVSGQLMQGSAVAGPGNITAWQAVNEGTYRQQVINNLNTTQQTGVSYTFLRASELVGTTYSKISTVFGGMSRDQLGLNIQALGLIITVNYADGSKQDYSWDPLGHTWAYVPHSSKDSSGNIIPDTPSDVAGTGGNAKIYSFPGTVGGSQDAISWYQRVAMFQISSPSPSTPSIIACVTTGSGGTARTTCTRQR